MNVDRQANWIYLQDELKRLRLLLARQIVQQARPTPDSEAESGAQMHSLLQELEQVSTQCRAAFQKTNMPLKQLAMEFGLKPFEIETVLLALAVELDTSFETLFAQCQPETSKRLPTVALALRLFSDSAETWVEAWQSFSTAHPLTRFGLIHLEARNGSLLSTAFHLDERIVSYLLGVQQPPAVLAQRTKVVRVATEQFLHKDQARRLGAIVEQLVEQSIQPTRLAVNLHGPQGSGKRTLAAEACASLGISVIAGNARDLVIDNTLELFLREAILQRAAVYLDCGDLPEDSLAVLTRACQNGGRLIFLGTLTRVAWGDLFPHSMWIPLEVRALTQQERKQLWQAHLGPRLNGEGELLAVRFPFTPGDIARVAESARTLALVRSPEDVQVSSADIWRAARAHPQHRLNELARRLEPRYTWDDIVLPESARRPLTEIAQQVEQQARVYDEWGFGRKLVRGRGVSALFTGTSGTGKTMAAEILAGALELDLYRIDLSSVVSKYIGETEKNLARVFDEAERSGVILFFDEADALFGKRSEVKDAHDRYANIEINYLLQRMEEYTGLAILATNMRQALDEAFLRRLRFVVEFPFPDAALRADIWVKSFPAEMPRTELDVDFLARQLKIPGGNIHNIAINAAFLAAAEGSPVQMSHVIRAAKREYEKIGRACLESDFGPYFELVK